MEALNNGDLEAEAMIDVDPEVGFIPNQKASHRVPEVYSSVNPTQKQHNGRSSGRQRKRRRDANFTYEGDSSEEDSVQDNMFETDLYCPTRKREERSYSVTHPIRCS